MLRLPSSTSTATSSSGKLVGNVSSPYPRRPSTAPTTRTRQFPSSRLHSRSAAAPPAETVVGSSGLQSPTPVSYDLRYQPSPSTVCGVASRDTPKRRTSPLGWFQPSQKSP